MSLSVSISGIDGCGKTSTIAGVSEQLGEKYLTAKIGRPSYILGPEHPKQELTNTLSGIIEDYRPIVNKRGIRPIIAGLNAAYAINQGQLTRNLLQQFKPQVIINSRDIIIDSIIYSTFYIPPSRHISTSIKSKALKFITGSNTPELFIYMDIEPQESIHRIIKSGRPLDTHETIERLTTLRNHYQEMVSYLYAHSNTKVYPINVTDLALPKVLEIITTTIQENM